MTHRKTVLRARPITIALRAALATLAVASVAPSAMADGALDKLIKPTNTLDIGGIYLNQSSDLFGQYNGLENSGPTLLGGFDLRGGDGYGQQPGANTWFVQGSKLGTTSRSVSGGIANQGSWSLGLSFDQLRNYGGDSLTTAPGSFQTPLLGNPGGNVYTLPSTFGYISTAGTGTQGLTADQQQFFHTDHLYVQRNTTRLDASHQLKLGWDLTFHWTSIRETGAILASAMVDSLTGGIITQSGTRFTSNLGGQKTLGLPYPTQYKTNNFQLALNWAGEKGFFTGAYYGSMFHDDYNGVWFPNPYRNNVTTGAVVGSTYPLDVESTPPSNTDNELQFSGGYHFNPKTLLVAGYSYGRNTQNMSYAYEPAQIGTGPTSLGGLPVGSLDGLVVTQHANWSLTHQTTKTMTLSAGMIYSKRDNQTASYLYNFEAPDSGPGTDWFSVYNIPMSNSHLQTKLGGDWRFLPGQRLHLALQNERVERWCDSNAYTANLVTPNDLYTGTGVSPTGCAAVPQSRENTVKLDYYLRPHGSLNFLAGVKWANRKATLNTSYYNPITDMNSGEADMPGWVAFFDASRRQLQGHFGVNWMVNSEFTMSLDGAVGNDQYGDSVLGRQSGHDATVDLEGDYQLGNQRSASVFATWQRQATDGVSAASGAGFNWVTGLRDQALTLGAAFKQAGLMDDKLSLMASLSYSEDTNNENTAVVPGSGSKAAATALSCATPSTSGYTCGNVPDLKTKITRLDLAAKYKLNPQSALHFGYMYARYDVNDYMYLAQMMGYTPTSVLPWNEQNPTVSVNAVYAEYLYSFQ